MRKEKLIKIVFYFRYTPIISYSTITWSHKSKKKYKLPCDDC